MADLTFKPNTKPNGIIDRLCVIEQQTRGRYTIEISRAQLVALAKILACDPTLCQGPNAKFRGRPIFEWTVPEKAA